MKLNIKGLSTEILTPVTVDCDGGEVTFTLKWMPIESKEVKTELAKLFSQSQRELGRSGSSSKIRLGSRGSFVASTCGRNPTKSS